jgi:ubiquinone/menaquinone biosynthesis C-methylase UbiE
MNEFSGEAIRQSGYLRDGFAEHYDAFRPEPPPVLLDALTRYAGGPPLLRVVDLGSGTGLSARAWADRAEEVVGVEPNPAMLAVARVQTPQRSVRFVEAYADSTGMPAGAADLVTCSQSLHWMEREPVLAEAARILRVGGVFAACDYDIPPLVDPEIDAAFADHLALRRKFREVHKLRAGWTRTPKTEHLDAIRESGRFRSARQVVLHNEQEVDAQRILGLARSLGLVPELKALGVTDEELGLERLTETTQRILGTSKTVWLLGYRIRLGVK